MSKTAPTGNPPDVSPAEIRRHLTVAGLRRKRFLKNAEAELVGILDVLLNHPGHVSQRDAEKLTKVSRQTFIRRLEKRRAERDAADPANGQNGGPDA